MCNLYSVTKGQAAIRALFRVAQDHAGNLPSMPGIFPDYAAPIIRMGVDGREVITARWGVPSLVFALKGRTSTCRSITIISSAFSRLPVICWPSNLRNNNMPFDGPLQWGQTKIGRRVSEDRVKYDVVTDYAKLMDIVGRAASATKTSELT